MEARRFHFSFPWITLYIALLIPLFTYGYAGLPGSLQNVYSLWLTSPFNISYELQNNGFLYNYVLVLIICLLVELYTRNIADLEGRDSIIRNAFLFSVLSSYVTSAIIWAYVGFPSSGTSIIAFNGLIFAAFETYDSELIMRMSEGRLGLGRMFEISSIVFIALAMILSMILFIYLNGNSFWYVHIIGGVIFAPLYYVYLTRWVRPHIDALEEKLEKEAKEDLEDTGMAIEKGAETLEKEIEKDARKFGRGRKKKNAKGA